MKAQYAAIVQWANTAGQICVQAVVQSVTRHLKSLRRKGIDINVWEHLQHLLLAILMGNCVIRLNLSQTHYKSMFIRTQTIFHVKYKIHYQAGNSYFHQQSSHMVNSCKTNAGLDPVFLTWMYFHRRVNPHVANKRYGKRISNCRSVGKICLKKNQKTNRYRRITFILLRNGLKLTKYLTEAVQQQLFPERRII